MVTLATLSFFCRRPTILAVMDFVNAINVEDENCESFSDDSSVDTTKVIKPTDNTVDEHHSVTAEESIIKGLLGKGKSRIVFQLTLNMARAQILLMYENETKLATLSQDNLLTEIKVDFYLLLFFNVKFFPFSFLSMSFLFNVYLTFLFHFFSAQKIGVPIFL